MPMNFGDTLNDPSYWQPIYISDGRGGFVEQKFLTPHWGLVTPFALTSGSQLRPDAPLMLTTDPDGYRQQAQQVLDISANLSDEQKAIAEYWSDGPGSETPPGHWNLLAQFVSQRDNHNLDDFDCPVSITDDDLGKIENQMRRIIKANLPIICESVQREEIRTEIAELNEPYKLEILERIPETEAITRYFIGSPDTGKPESSLFVTDIQPASNYWWDLCAGPHINFTGEIEPQTVPHWFVLSCQQKLQLHPDDLPLKIDATAHEPEVSAKSQKACPTKTELLSIDYIMIIICKAIAMFWEIC